MSSKFQPRPGRPVNAKSAADIQADRDKANAEFRKHLDAKANRPPQQAYVELVPEKNPNPTEESTPRDADGVVLDSTWEQIDLPSGFIFYDWSSISVRRFEIMDQAKLARAIRHKNTSLVLDVLASTSNRDSRELSIGDFKALCLWHRHNSYANSGLNVQWVSQYGNRVDVQIKQTSVKVTKPEKTRADYLIDKERGFCVPTARDLETIEINEIDEDILYLFNRAQFIDPAPLADMIAELAAKGDRIPTVTARIKRLEELGKGTRFQIFTDADEFAESYQNFGVQEIASILDDKFEPVAALEFLRNTNTEDSLKEAQRIQDIIDAGGTPKAVAEEVPLTFVLWNMFPFI